MTRGRHPSTWSLSRGSAVRDTGALFEDPRPHSIRVVTLTALIAIAVAPSACGRSAGDRATLLLGCGEAPTAPQPERGVLRVNTTPRSEVFVDGKSVGETPVMKLELPTGRHCVEVVNGDDDLGKRFSVDIEAGKTATRVLRLDTPLSGEPCPKTTPSRPALNPYRR